MGTVVTDDISEMIDKYFYAMDYAKIIDDIEKVVITKALERSCGNRIAAARILGLHRNTLANKIRRFNIDVEGFKK